jgi:hypothetical protein
MTTRILPVAEYPRLAGTECELVWPHLPPEAQVVVVEQGGQVVGCHTLIPYWHLECLWLAPRVRGTGSAARRLWSAVQTVALGLGARAVLTTAIDDRVRGLLAHVGATQLPGECYVVPMRGSLMPAVIPLAIVAAGAIGGIGAAKISSGASNNAADIQAKSASDAMALTAKGNADTLQYEKDQAAQTQANFNTTQKANYDQWAAAQQRKSAYGQMFGAPAQDIPAYQAPTTLASYATTPPATTTTPGGSSSTSPAPTSGDASTQALAAFYKSIGVTPGPRGSGGTDIAYYADALNAHGGPTADNLGYFTDRIKTDLSKASTGGGAAATSTPSPYTTLSSYGAPAAPPITGYLSMPTPGSLGSYGRTA